MTDDTTPEEEKERTEEAAKPKSSLRNLLIAFGIALAVVVTLATSYFGYLFTSSPPHIRYPEYAHYHFRTQLLVDGESVDFSSESFQQEYDAFSCSAKLPEKPIDFHDQAEQMTHIHWKGMTGGEFLKYYGWNFIGGNDSVLGRRYDIGSFVKPADVPIYGRSLPKLPSSSNYYVYVGDESTYETRSWDTFLNSDLEILFSDSASLEGSASSSVFDLFTAKAYAHGGANDGDAQSASPGETEEQRLERINSLVGNLVIFAQEQEPTVEQIQERFNNLAPLEDSVCGG